VALVLGLGVSLRMFLKEKEAVKRALAAERSQTSLRLEAETARAKEAALRQQAQANEQKATTESRKSEQVAQFLKEMLKGVGPSAALGRDTVMLKEILSKTSERVGRDLTNQPEVQAELYSTIGEVYFELMDNEPAESMLRKALQLYDKLGLAESPEAAAATRKLGDTLGRAGVRLEEARLLLERAVAMNQRLFGQESLPVANSMSHLAMALMAQRKLAEAEQMIRNALAMQRKLFTNDTEELADSLINFAMILWQKGVKSEAQETAREALVMAEETAQAALTMNRKVLGASHPQVGLSLEVLAECLLANGKTNEADESFTQAVLMDQKLLGPKHWYSGQFVGRVATMLQAHGKTSEAEALWRRQLQDLVSSRNQDGQWPEALRGLADLLIGQGKQQEAEQLFADTLGALRGGPEQRAALLMSRGFLRSRLGHWKDAQADLAQAIELDSQDHWPYFCLAALLARAEDHPGYLQLVTRIESRFAATTDPVVAERMAKACLILAIPGRDLAIESKWAHFAVSSSKEHLYAAWFAFCQSLAEYRVGRFRSAVEWCQQVLADANHDVRPDIGANLILAMAHQKLDQSSDAREALANAARLADTSMPKLENGDLGPDWLDWLMIQAWFREARELIGSEPSDYPKPK
jgi:tetratricopeptide (TPR) repeat protein